MIREQTHQVLEQLLEEVKLTDRHLLVVGVSTSEVMGGKIGTQGNSSVAKEIFESSQELQKQYGFHLAFQCCEHLNRALVMERATQEKFGYTEVSVIPVPHAGGAMASYAFRHFSDSVVVEAVQADAGIDIGDTLIGMHLKPVAVPIRTKQRTIGQAHVVIAKTRPKLIGGARAIYIFEQ